MDFNAHLHNARYISLALEALPQQIYNANQIKGFRIIYRAPLTVEDTITIRCHTVEHQGQVSVSLIDIACYFNRFLPLVSSSTCKKSRLYTIIVFFSKKSHFHTHTTIWPRHRRVA